MLSPKYTPISDIPKQDNRLLKNNTRSATSEDDHANKQEFHKILSDRQQQDNKIKAAGDQPATKSNHSSDNRSQQPKPNDEQNQNETNFVLSLAALAKPQQIAEDSEIELIETAEITVPETVIPEAVTAVMETPQVPEIINLAAEPAEDTVEDTVIETLTTPISIPQLAQTDEDIATKSVLTDDQQIIEPILNGESAKLQNNGVVEKFVIDKTDESSARGDLQLIAANLLVQPSADQVFTDKPVATSKSVLPDAQMDNASRSQPVIAKANQSVDKTLSYEAAASIAPLNLPKQPLNNSPLRLPKAILGNLSKDVLFNAANITELKITKVAENIPHNINILSKTPLQSAVSNQIAASLPDILDTELALTNLTSSDIIEKKATSASKDVLVSKVSLENIADISYVSDDKVRVIFQSSTSQNMPNNLSAEQQIGKAVQEFLTIRNSNGNVKEITLQLFPENLGAVKVQILAFAPNAAEGVKAQHIKISVEKRETLELLESSKQELLKNLKIVTDTKEEAALEFEMNKEGQDQQQQAYFEDLEERQRWMQQFAGLVNTEEVAIEQAETIIRVQIIQDDKIDIRI